MKSVGIKKLKNSLSEHVQLEAKGENALITNRDRAVAELSPANESHSTNLADEFLEDLIESGVLTPATLNNEAPPRPKPVASVDEILDELNEDRQDRG